MKKYFKFLTYEERKGSLLKNVIFFFFYWKFAPSTQTDKTPQQQFQTN